MINKGSPVQIFMYSQSVFGEGAYIDFYCEAEDTRYTTTNVYYVEVEPQCGRARHVRRAIADRGRGRRPAAYTEIDPSGREHRHRAYAAVRRGRLVLVSPLLAGRIAALPNWTTKSFAIDNYVPEAGPAIIDAEVWGSANRYCNPDHFFDVEVNGELALSDSFDGLTVHKFSVADANLQERRQHGNAAPEPDV